jgi:hypothetical protein
MAMGVPPDMDLELINREPGGLMLDLALNYEPPAGKWNVNFYMKNVTNYAEKNGFLMGHLRIGAPRTFGVVLSARF